MRFKGIGVDCRMIDRSGIGRYLRELINRSSLADSSLRCHVTAGIDLGEIDVFLDSSALYGLREQFTRSHYSADLFWTPHYNFPLLATSPQVVTVHDLAHLALPEVFGRGIKRLYAKLYFALISLWVDHVFFVSEFTATEYLRILGFAPRSSEIIPNGVGDFWFGGPLESPPRPSAGVRGVLMVGNVKPHKNLRRFLNGMKSLASSGNIEVWIVGKRSGFLTGEGADPIFAAPWIRWFGEVSDEELRELYRNAACFAMPSLYEGFGLPILEAMAAGCPVVASAIGAHLEICECGGAPVAEFFDPLSSSAAAGSIRKVLGWSAKEKESRVTRAREHARQFSWDRCALRTWASLASLRRFQSGIVI